MVATEHREERQSPFDALIDGLGQRLRQEPVAMSVALAILAAALTDSVTAFAIVGAFAWFAAQRFRGRDASRRA